MSDLQLAVIVIFAFLLFVLLFWGFVMWSRSNADQEASTS